VADVFRLPTAGSKPIEQRPRRGRLPKYIGNLSEARYRRFCKAEEIARSERERGMDMVRDESQAERDKLTEAVAELTALAMAGQLRSLVYAAEIPRHPIRMGMAGRLDKTQALAMAARLQHRIASCIESGEEDDDSES
jgi:hypothetical protein